MSDRQQKGKTDVAIGTGLLLLDFAIILFLVIVFDLNETEKSWETAMAFLTILILPILSAFFIVRGMIRMRP